MNKPWFDAQTGVLMLDEYVEAMPSFRKVLEDGLVSDDELDCHAHRVVELLQQLDERLPDDLRALATDALCELAVLYALQRRHNEQSLRFCPTPGDMPWEPSSRSVNSTSWPRIWPR